MYYSFYNQIIISDVLKIKNDRKKGYSYTLTLFSHTQCYFTTPSFFSYTRVSIFPPLSLCQVNSGKINWACSVQLPLLSWDLAKLQSACSAPLSHKVYKGLPRHGEANPILGIDIRKPTCPQVLVTFSNVRFISNKNAFVDFYTLFFGLFSQLGQNLGN